MLASTAVATTTKVAALLCNMAEPVPGRWTNNTAQVTPGLRDVWHACSAEAGGTLTARWIPGHEFLPARRELGGKEAREVSLDEAKNEHMPNRRQRGNQNNGKWYKYQKIPRSAT